MSLSYEDLFARRIAFQDTFEDENLIIKELKHELYSHGMNNMDDIDKYLVEFYKNYGIEISLDIIKSIQINPVPTQFINSLINMTARNNSNASLRIPPGIVNFYNHNLNNLTQLPSGGNLTNDSDDVLSDIDSDEIPELEDDFDDDLQESNNSQQIPIQFLNMMNNSSQNSNISNFVSIFNNIMHNSVNTPPPDWEEPVKKTLRKDDEKLIKKYKLKESLEEKCSICLSSLDKDQDVWELPCKHIFHPICIEKLLKEYDYKCPVCRKECGEGEANL